MIYYKRRRLFCGGRLERAIEDDILHCFKIGYTLNKACDELFWDDLELMIAHRTALTEAMQNVGGLV